MANKEAVPLKGSKVKAASAVCPMDCLRECTLTEKLAGCTETLDGNCTIVSDGGVVLADKEGSKAIIDGVLCY